MRPSTKEEEDIDVIRSWMEVGGHPAHLDEEAKELLTEVNAFLCFFLALSTSHLLICYQFFPHNLDVEIVTGFFLLLYRV